MRLGIEIALPIIIAPVQQRPAQIAVGAAKVAANQEPTAQQTAILIVQRHCTVRLTGQAKIIVPELILKAQLIPLVRPFFQLVKAAAQAIVLGCVPVLRHRGRLQFSPNLAGQVGTTQLRVLLHRGCYPVQLFHSRSGSGILPIGRERRLTSVLVAAHQVSPVIATVAQPLQGVFHLPFIRYHAGQLLQHHPVLFAGHLAVKQCLPPGRIYR